MISITKFISMKSAARKRKSSRYRTFRPTLENLEARNLMAGDMHGAFLDVPADAAIVDEVFAEL